MEGFGRTDGELARLPLGLSEGLLSGRVSIISGAGSGIGRAIAHWFARLGSRLVLCGRDLEKLKRVKDALATYGCEAVIHAMSIRDPTEVTALHERAWSEFGKVDILVNNAGGQFPQSAIDFSTNGWNAVIDTNLNGAWRMMQAAARKWRDAGRGGAIVNIVAVTDRGMPGIAHTCAARAGVIGLCKTLAVEWAPLDIRVNCVAPGVISTEGMAVYSEEVRESFATSNPMMRFGEVEDIASMVAFLSSEMGRFITGEVINVDGGNHLWGDQWAIPKPAYFREK